MLRRSISATEAAPIPIRAAPLQRRGEPLAHRRREDLGVGQALDRREQDHRGRDHRPGERPAADLVDAGDQTPGPRISGPPPPVHLGAAHARALSAAAASQRRHHGRAAAAARAAAARWRGPR